MESTRLALIVLALGLILAIFSCVLDLTWAPVHDAPNEIHFHASATPTAATTPLPIPGT